MRTLMLVLLLFAGTARAGDLDPDGALARWLDAEAGPELAQVLSRHPRFAGATTAFVAVVDGVPTQQSDRLHDAIERRLRGHLLRNQGVRLALSSGADACASGARPDLLVGIEIVSRGPRAATVALGLIDAVEGVWVSGVAHDWRGTLSTAERRARATPSPTSAAALRALPVSDADAIAEALLERLRCTWPAGFGGRVHLAAGSGPAGAARIAAALRARLARGASVLVAEPAAADWRLLLELDERGQAPEARLLLAPRGDAPGQQLASVFVTPAAGDVVASAVPTAPTAIPVTAGAVVGREPALRPALIAAAPRLEQVDLEGVCRRGGRDVLCAELVVALERPGWLFVFSTRDGRAEPLACDASPARSDAGERRFRFSVGAADAPGRPDTGVYVLAVRERGLARELARTLRSAPGACGTRAGRPLEYWLGTLAELFERHPARIEWHAVHLARQGDRVIRI